MRIVLCCLFLFFLSNAFAANEATSECTKRQAVEAEKESDTLKDWHRIYRSYKRFSQCDDGAIAEGYSDSVTKLLAEDWNSFSLLVALTNRSRGFRAFVIKHIDETVPAERLVRIAKNARSECPAAGHNLCLAIAKATEK